MNFTSENDHDFASKTTYDERKHLDAILIQKYNYINPEKKSEEHTLCRRALLQSPHTRAKEHDLLP